MSHELGWEIAGVVLILIFAAPFAYLLYVAVQLGSAFWKHAKRHQVPKPRIIDPAFGALQLVDQSLWEGRLFFSATQHEIHVFVRASEDGPTDEHRSLFKAIEERYEEVLPDILKSLADYVVFPADFELCDIFVAIDPVLPEWTAQYVAKTDEDGDMGYFVEMQNWSVTDVAGAD